jgi:adenylate cyclase
MAKLFEMGVWGLIVVAMALVVIAGAQVSIWVGLLVLLAAIFGLPYLIYNFDYWLVRQLREVDPHFMFGLCESGFVSRARRLVGRLPANPRCRFCQVPFSGVGGLLRIRPSAKNPNFCRSCFEALPVEHLEMEVGVLFADIRGYTSWTENHSALEAAAILERFYALANRVLSVDDVLIEFVGDQVMALYLTIMPSLGDRTSGVMLAGARRLVTTIRQEDDTLPIGVGVNIGRCQVGNFAKGGSKDFTAIGDVVNTAARLQSAANAYEIVLSEAVYAAVSEQAGEVRPTRLALKGKAEQVSAYVIAGVR